MKITTTSIDGFISNINNATGVFNDTIYIEQSQRSLNGKSRVDATSFQIFFQLSAVLEFADGGQALLTCGIDCGIDRKTQDGGRDGSDVADEMKREIHAFCVECNFILMSGVLDQ